MRIRLIFNVLNPNRVIPFHHQMILSEFFHNLIKKENIKPSEYKSFNFSGIKGMFSSLQEGLKVKSDKATIVVSSLDGNFLKLLSSLALRAKHLKVGELFMEVAEVMEEQEIAISSSEVKFLCLSPIILIDPDNQSRKADEFIDPNSGEFSDLLYESTISRIEKLGMYSEEQLESFNRFQIIPDRDFILKMKKSEKKYSRAYTTYINDERKKVYGYTFPFTLYAAPEIQKLVFEAGMGELTEYGYGMLDLVNNKFTERT